MLTIKGTYDGKEIKPDKPVPVKKSVDVIITILDDDLSNQKSITEKYERYYQNLTARESEDDFDLCNELQVLDNDTNSILEDQEN